MSLIPTGHSSSSRSGSATLRVLGIGAGALYLTTAAVGYWAAFDRGEALPALAAIGGGLLLAAIFVLLARRNSATVAVLGFLALAGAAVLAQALLLGWGGNPGPYAGSIAVLLPLGVATAAWCFALEHRLAGWATLLVALLCLGVLATAGERAPLVALVAGGLMATTATALVQPDRHWFWRVLLGFGVLALLALAGLYGALIVQPTLLPTRVAELAPSLVDRLQMWNGALPLVRDYLYVGSGPANTPMVHASYALLSHVPYIQHVHNLPLQIAIEQGFIGMLAFLALLGSAILAALLVSGSDADKPRLVAPAVLAALLTLLVLGLVEGEFSLTPFQVVLFLPMAAAWSLHRSVLGTLFEHSEIPRQRWAGSLLAAAALLALVIGPIVYFGASAAYSNSAAVRQQQIELSVYNQPTWSFQDRVRREYAPALEPVIAEYERAIALDPGNASAQRRLGQILLSLGRSEEALSHLLAASATERSLPTLLLLGEALALNGDTDRAAALWQGLDAEQDQIWLRWAWHDSIGDSAGAALLEKAAATVAAKEVGSAP